MWVVFQIIFLLGSMCGFVFLWNATRRGNFLYKWRKIPDFFYRKGHHEIADFLGECQICFAHFIAWLSFILNAVMLRNIWLINSEFLGGRFEAVVGNIFYCLAFVAISHWISSTQYHKLLKEDND